MSEVARSITRFPGRLNRFLLLVIAQFVSGGGAVLTLVWPRWLEAVGFDPDHGDGAVESGVALALLGVTVMLTLALSVTLRRWRPVPGVGNATR